MPSPYEDPDAGRRDRGRPSVTMRTAKTKAPALPDACAWPADLREWWSTVWCSTLTADWDERLDFRPVYRLGELYLSTDGADDVSAAVLAQVTRLESELGLTPAARKRQHVKPAAAVDPAVKPKRKRGLVALPSLGEQGGQSNG